MGIFILILLHYLMIWFSFVYPDMIVYTIMWILFYLLLYVLTLHQLHWLHCFKRYVAECVWSTEFGKSVSRSCVYTECSQLYRVIRKDGLNFVRLYFLNYTWYVNYLHNI